MQIGIIGHFGGKKVLNDGQTVKTITLYEALKQRLSGDIRLQKIDTYYIRKNPVVFCLQFLSCVMFDQKIIVLLSENGRRVLFPVLFLLSKYLKKEIYHDCIAGRLAQEASKSVKFRRYLSEFKANWVESRYMRDKLREAGIVNAGYIPNFKRLCVIHEKDISMSYEIPYRFVTFSRVMPEKGIEDAIKAIEAINKEAGRTIATLHIYGPIKKGYEERFKACLKSALSCEYKGIVPANESVSILKHYYALLFPTCCKGEGMPGTVVDAFSAGLPVIARRWPLCDEYITHGMTGYVYDFDAPEELPRMILYSIQNSSEIVRMKKNCVKKASEFSESSAVESILKSMGIQREYRQETAV